MYKDLCIHWVDVAFHKYTINTKVDSGFISVITLAKMKISLKYPYGQVWKIWKTIKCEDI